MEKIINQIPVVLLLTILLFSSCERLKEDAWSTSNRKLIIADKLEFAKKNFDDSEWNDEVQYKEEEVFWVRMHAEFKKEGFRNKGINVGAAATYEAYWDGVYIGNNKGQLNSEEKDEIHGKYISYFQLPDSLVGKGKHVLALRMTKTHPTPGFHAYFEISDYFELVRYPLHISKYMFMIGGAFLLTAVYFLFLWFSRMKEYSTLIFSFICLVFLSLLIMEYLKYFYFYDYPFQRTRLHIIGIQHIILALLVPWFFMIQFSFPWKKQTLGLLVIIIALLEYKYHLSFDWLAEKYNMLMWLFLFIPLGYACYKKMKGSYPVTVVLVLGFMFTHIISLPKSFFSSFDFSLFIGFVLIILSMLYVYAIKRKEERLAFEESLILSERLKNELLRKNIKPHFIMNTLTSLMDWVEESPKEGVKFITALSNEFEVLNDIADYKLIPIEQEIKLCKSHLDVMGYRKEVSYQWEEKGIDLNEIIPPAIIHTAVENGVTHSLPNEEGEIIFILSFEKKKTFKEYKLTTIAKNRKQKKSKIKGAGTGLKYIKSRLQESYPDNWNIKSNATSNGWETIIKIFVV